MSQNYYKPADHNAICDSCGFKFKASQLRKRWDKFMVCEQDWEQRHPQELIKAPIEINFFLIFTTHSPADGASIKLATDNFSIINPSSLNHPLAFASFPLQ